MKKKILTLVLSISAVVSCAFGFSACEGATPPESSSSDSSTPIESGSSDGSDSVDGSAPDENTTPELQDLLVDFEYTLTETECIITGLKNTTLTKIVIPDGVTAIAPYAFEDCDDLISVVIGASVTSIGECAFDYCDGLIEIIFEDTTTWYRTYNISDWENKTGGEEIDVSDPEHNIRFFVENCSYYSVYKL